jgi:ribosome-binding factor A
MFGLRRDRLSQQLQQEIATIIHQEIKDPGLGFVTITKVELSNDLSYAKVNYSCLGGASDRERSKEALDRASGFIHSLIKKRLRLKIIPTIVFQYDQTIEQAIEMAKVLDELKKSDK